MRRFVWTLALMAAMGIGLLWPNNAEAQGRWGVRYQGPNVGVYWGNRGGYQHYHHGHHHGWHSYQPHYRSYYYSPSYYSYSYPSYSRTWYWDSNTGRYYYYDPYTNAYYYESY